MNCTLFDGTTTVPFQCNNVTGSDSLITGELAFSNYGYFPSKTWAIVFTAVFGVAFVAQLLEGIFFRAWWTLPTLTTGAFVELLGWAGRVWSATSWEWDSNQGGQWSVSFASYIMQICCLVIAPTFYSAANYILLGKIIAATGPLYTSLHSQSFSIIFVSADILCLVIQAAGGGIAGSADDDDGADQGAYIMTGGVILQLVVTILYTVLFIEWVWRKRIDKPTKRQYNPFGRFFKNNKHSDNKRDTLNSIEMSSPSATLVEEPQLGNNNNINSDQEKNNMNFINPMITNKQKDTMLYLIAIGTILIIVRSVYRSIELLDGWTGEIAINEPLFLGLDAFLMALFIYIYSVVFPGAIFGKRMF
ncbi:uncharacterized protein L201_005861 [Kwoniella dendrophila CBS 6074]|uniref:Uncharacterized protein n=1 Tax=Kwoniella dendrophila CBS 6074 TaxID=1295534 RepID=A0AAX4K1A5_9TREE